MSEDCLYLNVYRTADTRPGQKKPVIVWIYGGGNIAGSSNDYDGSMLAKGGTDGVPTIVVTMNYRMGIFGIFSHPAVDKGQSRFGNYLTLDQQAALRWVQRNIASFGGDPNNVTIAGQSAGQTNVMANVLSPLAKGLFQRAIPQSSPGHIAWLPTAEATRGMGMRFAEAAGCPGLDESAAKCLRSLSAARLLQLQGTVTTGGPFTTGFPFVDGTIIPVTPEQAWTSGNFNRVPIMGGGTRDEATFFYPIALYQNPSAASSQAVTMPRTADDYARASSPGNYCIWCNAERKVPVGTAETYPLAQFNNDPLAAYAAIGTDGSRCRELHVLQAAAAHAPVYHYDFVYRDAPFYFPKYAGFKPNAAHTIELQFLFNDFHGGHLGVNLDQMTGTPRGLNAAEERLSDLMVGTWTRFAKTGNPNRRGESSWPALSRDPNSRVMVLDLQSSTKSVAQFRADYKCDFFDPQLKY